MTVTSPYDTNTEFFKFNPNSSGLANSSFSTQYQPQYISAYAANPNAQIAGGINPNNTQTTQAQQQEPYQDKNPVRLNSPTLTSFGPSSGSQLNQEQSSPNNSAAMQVFSATGKKLLPQITNSIDSFGAGLGFSSPVTYGTSFGPSALGAAETFGPATAEAGVGTATGLTSASLSGTLGAAGLGFIGGGILASAIGGNATGGSIGGAIGAGVGYAGGAAAAAALGLQLGAFAGPVGAIVGGIGGALFGSVFGPGAPTSAAAGVYVLDKSGNISLSSTGNKNPQGNANVPSQIGTALQQQMGLAKTLGINLNIPSDYAFTAGVNTKHSPSGQPGYVQVGDQTYGFTPGDQASQTTAINNTVLQLAKMNGASADQIAAFSDALKNGTAMNGASSTPISIPNNPTSNEPNDFQKFLNEYKAKQDANAAPSPTI